MFYPLPRGKHITRANQEFLFFCEQGFGEKPMIKSRQLAEKPWLTARGGDYFCRISCIDPFNDVSSIS
jgi:hypothetical protein